VFILSGVASGTAAVFGGTAAFITLFATLLPGVALLVVYSYFAWKSDPEKIPAQDTRPGPDGAAG
jgi:hypothetical protein